MPYEKKMASYHTIVFGMIKHCIHIDLLPRNSLAIIGQSANQCGLVVDACLFWMRKG